MDEIVFIGVEARLREKLAILAAKRKVSMREIIRRALTDYERAEAVRRVEEARLGVHV